MVYTHPTGHACYTNLIPGMPDTVVKYGTDTTRAITSLLFSGASQRYPDIWFVFLHAGGTAPFLMEQFRFMAASPAQAARFGPGGTGTWTPR